MTDRNFHSLYKSSIWITVIICLGESLAKGWASLILLPVSAVVLPLYVWVELVALRHWKSSQDKWIIRLATALTIALLLAYVATVGYGDTDQVLLFGFYASTTGAALTTLSMVVCGIASVAAVLLWIGLVILNIRTRHSTRQK